MSNKKPLLRGEKLYSKIFQDLGAAIFVADPETGIILDANRAAERLVGRPIEEIIGMHQSELHPHEEEERYKQIFGEHAGSHQGMEKRAQVIRKDGRLVPVSINARVETIEGRSLVLGLFQNLTELELAERRYSEGEDLFKQLAGITDTIILIYQGDKIRYMNRAAQEFFGYTFEEAIRMNFWDLCHPEDRETIINRVRRRLRGEPVPHRYQARALTRDGDTRWVDYSAGVIDLFGEPAGFLTAFDITDSIRVERELEESNRQLLACLRSAKAMGSYARLQDAAASICEAARVAFDALLVWIGLVVTDSTEATVLASAGRDEGYTDKVHVHWDESARAGGPFGRSVKERETTVMEVSDPSFRPWREEAEKRGFKTVCSLPLLHEEAVRGAILVYGGEGAKFDPETLEKMEIFARQATITIVNESLYREATATILELEEANKALNRAEAELKKKIEELQISQERVKQVTVNSRDTLWEVDRDLNYTYIGGAFESLSGQKAEDRIGKPVGIDMSEEEQARVAPQMQGLKDNPAPFGPMIINMRDKDGNISTLESRGVPVYSSDGEFTGYRGISRDVTDRIRMDAALRASEKKYRELVDNLNEGIGVVDEDENIVMANPAFCEIFNLEEGKCEGVNLSSVLTEEEFRKIKKQSEKRARGEKGNYTVTLIGANNEKRTLKLTTTPLFDRDGNYRGATGIVLDITEKDNKGADPQSRDPDGKRTPKAHKQMDEPKSFLT